MMEKRMQGSVMCRSYKKEKEGIGAANQGIDPQVPCDKKGPLDS